MWPRSRETQSRRTALETECDARRARRDAAVRGTGGAGARCRHVGRRHQRRTRGRVLGEGDPARGCRARRDSGAREARRRGGLRARAARRDRRRVRVRPLDRRKRDHRTLARNRRLRAMARDDGMTIRSFRIAFEFERRIFKLDRWRLPVAYGVPLRSVGYAVALVVAVVLGSRLPLVQDALGAVSPPVKFVVAPSVGAYLLTRVDVDGRPAHAAVWAWLRHIAAPRRLVAYRRRS